jgi:DNA-binding Lrp family transcriptional regulator
MRNSRRSDKELAKTLRISQPTANRIVKKLENEGYIKEYDMIPDFAKLGYELLSITFVKLRKELTPDEIDEARTVTQRWLKERPEAIIMLERGIGLGYDGVFIVLHEDYSSHVRFTERLKEFPFVDGRKVESFVINLEDPIHYRPLTMAHVATHCLSMKDRLMNV